MEQGAHKGNTKDFGELTYQEQAKSINAQIANLQAAILHHIAHAPVIKSKPKTKEKCLRQITRLLYRVQRFGSKDKYDYRKMLAAG